MPEELWVALEGGSGLPAEALAPGARMVTRGLLTARLLSVGRDRPWPYAITRQTDPSDPGFLLTHVTNQWLIPSEVDQVTMRVRIRPIGLDVLDDLIGSGDLDPALRDEMPVFDLGATVLEWRVDGDATPYGSFLCVR